MNTLNIVESFADGQVLFESDLDNICNSLTDFFNITQLDSTNLQSATAQRLMPTGTVVMYGSQTPPAGWLNCDGAAVSRTAFATLYGVIRTTFGVGDGSTTFNLPDYRGNIPVGMGGVGTSVLGNAIGNTGGEATHTLASDKSTLPSHGHTDAIGHDHQETYTTTAGSTDWTLTPIANQNSPFSYVTGMNTSAATPVYNNTGGGGAHNNVQPSLTVNFIIKV